MFNTNITWIWMVAKNLGYIYGETWVTVAYDSFSIENQRCVNFHWYYLSVLQWWSRLSSYDQNLFLQSFHIKTSSRRFYINIYVWMCKYFLLQNWWYAKRMIRKILGSRNYLFLCGSRSFPRMRTRVLSILSSFAHVLYKWSD